MMLTASARTGAQQGNLRNAPTNQWNGNEWRTTSHSDNIYSRNCLQTTESLTKAQLALGVIIIALQIITTTFDDNFQRTLIAELFANDASLGVNSFGDINAAGIWTGSMMMAAAAIGMSGYRRQSKCMIITHLVFNTVVLLFTVIAIGFVSSVINELNFCKDPGEDFSWPVVPHPDQEPFVFYGQTLQESSKNFRCFHVIFSVWSALDGLILASCVAQLIVTVILIVLNSLALCHCCRLCCFWHRSSNTTSLQTPYRSLTTDIARSQQPMAQPIWWNQMATQGVPPSLAPTQANHSANPSLQPRPQGQVPPNGPGQLTTQTPYTTGDGQLPQD